jgi:uncharacterized protein (DUF2141 family)
MHSRLVGMLLCSLALCSIAVRAAAEDLTIEVQHVTPNAGPVMVAVYDKAEDFPTPEKGLNGQAIEAQSDSAVATFHGLAAGRYAVAVYQDLNRNGKLDKNFLGLPTEPYGFSKDARGSFGPPSFDAAAVDIPATQRVVINLR